MASNITQCAPTSHHTVPAVAIRAADCAIQSNPTDGRGVMKRSAAGLGNYEQNFVVVTPMCKKRPHGQAVNDHGSVSTTTDAHDSSLLCPQRTANPTGHCSDKQGTLPAPAPMRPNMDIIVVTPMCTKKRPPVSNGSAKSAEGADKDATTVVTAPITAPQKSQHNPKDVIVVTPMCTKKPPAVSDGSTEGANNAPSDATKALITELETTHMSLKEIGNVAALLEADLQAANAAAEMVAARKERDDAEALERQQEAEQREAALLKELAARDEKERALQTEKAALEKRLTEAVDAKIGAAAAKANTAREVKKLREQLATRDTQLVAAKAECHEAQEDLSANEAALAAALQTSEKVAKELKDEQEKRAKLKVFAKTQVTRIGVLEREKVAAEAKAALAAAQKAESERAAAEKLRDADRKNKDLAEALQKEKEESASLKAAQAISVSQTESIRQKLVAAKQSAAQAISNKIMGERAAAQRLQKAHRDLAAADKEITSLEAAREDAKQQAASAAQQAAAEQTMKRAAFARAEAAEAALSAANTDIQLACAEADDAQGRIRTLAAEVSAGENTIADLQGRLMGTSVADAPFVPATPEDHAQSASTPDAMPSAPATADNITPVTFTCESNPSTPAPAEEDTTPAASEVPRDSPASLGQPQGPALPRLPEEAPARSAAAKTFSPVKKIAGVFKGLVSIMAADVTRWQTAQVSRWAEAQ